MRPPGGRIRDWLRRHEPVTFYVAYAVATIILYIALVLLVARVYDCPGFSCP